MRSSEAYVRGFNALHEATTIVQCEACCRVSRWKPIADLEAEGWTWAIATARLAWRCPDCPRGAS